MQSNLSQIEERMLLQAMQMSVLDEQLRRQRVVAGQFAGAEEDETRRTAADRRSHPDADDESSTAGNRAPHS